MFTWVSRKVNSYILGFPIFKLKSVVYPWYLDVIVCERKGVKIFFFFKFSCYYNMSRLC